MIAFGLCHTCGVKHPLEPKRKWAAMEEFSARHVGHQLDLGAMPLGSRQVLERYRLTEAEWLDYIGNADIKQAFGTSTALTITLASLANNGARESTAVDNTANLFLDALVYLAIPLQTGIPANEKRLVIYAYGSEDGTNYTDNATGVDAAVTLRSPTNFVPIGTIETPDAGALTYKSHPLNIALGFGGVMPRKWGIVVSNKTGLTLNATEGNLIKTFSGTYNTVI